ncbi:MAG TPA: protein-L-isoaspartate(D-aspartate) O-methyltransferase [Candidatus Kryptonia bacterium]|nr:protein-L-isoaspartate(D-aspartate) O-methyltransferase [Candidatus Kryptonia bacterium]
MGYEIERRQMVNDQLGARGISDRRVLGAMRTVPRHRFVGASQQAFAYEDRPLPIGAEQTISQPYMVALMTEALGLRGGERVLELGTGSGYQAAILAELGAQVYTIERLAELGVAAERRLIELGYWDRVHVRIGDGAEGWPEMAPFNAIVITAAAQRIPRALLQQLDPSGCLVLPLGEADLQGLARVRRNGDAWQEEYFGECRFVKLIGADGWDES